MLPQWLQDAGVIGAFVLGAAWAIRTVRLRLFTRHESFYGVKNGRGETAAGMRRTDDWESWFKRELRDSVIREVKAVHEDVAEVRREVARLADVVDPSLRTPRGGRGTS